MLPAQVTRKALTPTTTASAASSVTATAVQRREAASAFTTCIVSSLLELDEGAAKILRVQKKHRLAVGADLRLRPAEDAGAGRHQPVARGADVLDLVADVVDAAARAALEEGGDGRAFPQGLQQLDLGVRQRHEHHR